MKLEELLLGGPGLKGYAYCADTYCVDCAQNIITENFSKLGTPNNTDYNNSDLWPIPIFFGEHEIAQYCAICEKYLYGDQTQK